MPGYRVEARRMAGDTVYQDVGPARLAKIAAGAIADPGVFEVRWRWEDGPRDEWIAVVPTGRSPQGSAHRMTSLADRTQGHN